MMEQLKNSVLSKVLQVLLTGYFLISSLNLNQSFSRIATTDTDVHKKESIVWHLVKKMLKCNTSAEEYEDGENEPCNSNNKIKLTIDYLLPLQTGIALCHAYTASEKKIYFSQFGLNGILCNKIHVPPPEITL